MLQHNSKVSNSKSNNKETSNPDKQAIPSRLSKRKSWKSQNFKRKT